jgi:hypothetical protein
MKKNDEENMAGEEYVFELAGYLMTCAEMALSPRGSPRYSALRFIEVVRRLIDLPKFVSCLKEDQFLFKIKKQLESLKIEQNDMEQLRSQLQAILVEFAEEGGRRSSMPV